MNETIEQPISRSISSPQKFLRPWYKLHLLSWIVAGAVCCSMYYLNTKPFVRPGTPWTVLRGWPLAQKLGYGYKEMPNPERLELYTRQPWIKGDFDWFILFINGVFWLGICFLVTLGTEALLRSRLERRGLARIVVTD